MALTPSGTISMSDINTALGRSATAAISFNDAQVRYLANQDTGAVSLNNMRNKYNFNGTITVGYFDNGKSAILGYGNGVTGAVSPTSLWGFIYEMGESNVGSSMYISNATPAPGTFNMRYKVNGVSVNMIPYYGVRQQWWNNGELTPKPFVIDMIGNTYSWQFAQA